MIWNLTVFLIPLLVLWLILKINYYLGYLRSLRVLPRLGKSHLIFGDLIYLKSNSDEPFSSTIRKFLHATNDKFKNEGLYVFWRGWIPGVLVSGRQAMEDVFSNKNLLYKGKPYDLVRDWIGDGLITSGGEKWRKRRKILTPSFHFKVLDDFFPIIEEHCIRMLEKWKLENVNEIDVTAEMPKLTLEILFETAMGISNEDYLKEKADFIEAVATLTHLTGARIFSIYSMLGSLYYLTKSGRKYKKALQIIHKFVTKVIKARIQSALEEKKQGGEGNSEVPESTNLYFRGRKRRQAFMDTLIDEFIEDCHNKASQRDVNFQDILDEVNTFMFAGHDTTAVALSYTTFLLGLHPEIQGKLYQEISENLLTTTEGLNAQKLNSLSFLDACVKESLRLFSPVPIITKRVSEELNLAGHIIPQGATLQLHLFFLHRNSEIFPQAETFNPDRFLDASSPHNKLPYSFVSFGAGPRNCIGQKFALLEIKIFIALLLMRYKLHSSLPLKDVEYAFEVVLRPISPLVVKLTERV